MGRFCLWWRTWGTPTPLDLPWEDTTMPVGGQGGRRRRRSQRPGCNDLDRVKVRQAWCPEAASYPRTWGLFTMGSL